MKVFLIHNWTLGAMEQFIFNLSTLKFSNTAAPQEIMPCRKGYFYIRWLLAWRGVARVINTLKPVKKVCLM